MQTFTTQQILAVRSLYTDLPYPGFSLDEVCRRKNAPKTALRRGENAWKLDGAAKSTEEWVRRLVQGTLNKLTPEMYKEMVGQLCNPILLETEANMNIAVKLIFQKALQEPGYSEMYARLCYEIARFEVNQNANATTPEGKRKSHFRDAIVREAQVEFASRVELPEAQDPSAPLDDDAEDPRSQFIRRKRANIKFIGQLFMTHVLSLSIMMQIIGVIMRNAKGGCPPSYEIEFLTELFETIGKNLDEKQEARKSLDDHFKHLKRLQSESTYPLRIRFKIMDLIDLRQNKWESRVTRAHEQAPTTLEEQERTQKQQAAAKPPAHQLNLRSPVSPTTRNRKQQHAHNAFPDTPAPQESLSSRMTGSGKDAPPANSGLNWRNIVAPTAPTREAVTPTSTTVTSGLTSSDAAGSANVQTVNFVLKVRNMLEEWVSEFSNDFIPQWMDEFRNCDESFPTAAALCSAVAAEVIRLTCMTTKKDAQREASSFLIVGLNLTDDEVFEGFASALAAAISDGVLEDVPKFSERLITTLRFVSGEENPTDLYFDTARILYMTQNRIEEPDEDTLDTLMSTWNRLPEPQEELDIPCEVVTALAELPSPGQEELACRIIHALVKNGLVSDGTVNEWMENPTSETGAAVVVLYQQTQ